MATEGPRFRRPEKAPPPPENPELLFGQLPRRPRGVPALWSHQADILRTYDELHRNTPDVALELPTGSGKTLVGLLIAEWRRRALGQRVAYACPTQQLAGQVAAAATAQGIPVALLVGKHSSWPEQQSSAYTRAASIAVTTYSTIFNSNPHLNDAQSLLFDDAHAGEQYVAGAWSMTIPGSIGLYDDLFDVLREQIEPQVVQRVTSGEADPREVHLLPVSSVAARLEDIDRVLTAGVAGTDLRYAFRMLRPGLRSCLFFVSRGSWYIRPMIPPTFTHDAFTGAEQRVYLSATLGEAGELERSLGRAPIARVPVPPAWERTGSGRRFFVFPALAEGAAVDHTGLLRDLSRLSSKQLLLAPSEAAVATLADTLQIPEDQRFDAKDGSVGITPFLEAEQGALLAANRYDGMDLKDDACHLEVLSGLPDATHLQDQFLAGRLRSGNVLTERVRTRVMQGAGRCTRGPQDWAVVVVHDERLLRFLERAEVQESLPVELQAEVVFGLQQSTGLPGGDLVQLARSALARDERWNDAEAYLAELRQEVSRAALPDADALTSSAPREVNAWQAAWEEDWERAAAAAVNVMDRLPGPALRGYRSLWAYLGSAWSTLAAAAGTVGAADRAARLLELARQAGQGITWLREVGSQPATPRAEDVADAGAARQVLDRIAGELKSATGFDRRIEKMLAGLAQAASGPYEQALVDLGLLLGAESYKPSGQGRADAVWVWNQLWASLEAKSEQQSEGPVSLKYVRQANSQLDSVAGDRAAEVPDESFSLIVSPRTVVEPAAVPAARPHLHLVRPELVLDVAHNAVSAWHEIRGAVRGVEGEEAVAIAAFALWKWQVQPTQVRERLTASPVRGG